MGSQYLVNRKTKCVQDSTVSSGLASGRRKMDILALGVVRCETVVHCEAF